MKMNVLIPAKFRQHLAKFRQNSATSSAILQKKSNLKNEKIESKCKWSPFNGEKFLGTPVATIINGEIKMKNGEILGDPTGKPMLF